MLEDDKDITNNIKEWYHKMQLCRRVPPRFPSARSYGTLEEKNSAVSNFKYCKPQCYMLTIRTAETNLKANVFYRIHAYFYDSQQKYFFGKPYYGEWHQYTASTIRFDEPIFYWTSFNDNVDIVLELVESEESVTTSDFFTAAWTSLRLENDGKSIPDRNLDQKSDLKRLPLYLGSPKALLYKDSSAVPWKVAGSLLISSQAYQAMNAVLNFIPDWFMFSRWEDIPGLHLSHNNQLKMAIPKALKSQNLIINELKISFGIDYDKFEQIILHSLNNDRLYRANRSPADINIKSMEVLERRIMIGVHNGLRYVEGPQCMHLNSLNDQVHGFSRITHNTPIIKSESVSCLRDLFMDGSIIMHGVIADPRFAIVFSLDYLVGVYSYDKTIHSSQSVIVSWGAWCPSTTNFKSNNEIRINLFGGPSINPNERLTFRNSLPFHHSLSSSNESAKIQITFTYSEIYQNDNSSHISDYGTKQCGYQPKLAENLKIMKQENRQEDDNHCDKIISSNKKEGANFASLEITNLPMERTSNICRGYLSALSEITFATFKDRNGKKPKIIDINDLPDANINIELNDRLNENETIIQFMGIEFSTEYEQNFNTPKAIFFTVQYYRFHSVTTERLLLDHLRSRNNQYIPLYVLKRKGIDEDIPKENPYGFTIKYMVDRNVLPDGEQDDYINYLLNGHAIIDAWDANSLLPIGKSYLPLKFLLRHGYEAVQVDIQTNVILGIFPGTPYLTCQLLLRLANIGHASTKKFDNARNRSRAVITRKLPRLGEEEIESFEVRAKPLNPIHTNSMQRFLTAQNLDINQRYCEYMDGVTKEKDKNWVVQPVTTKKSVTSYLFQQELEAYKKLRNEDKASKLLKVVFKAITTEHRIYPKYGQVIFFEYMLQNTESEPTIVIVDIAQKLWQCYKNLYQIDTPLERNLYRLSEQNEMHTSVEIFLRPFETVYAPFIYDAFSLFQDQIQNQVKVVFKKKINGEPISILDLLIDNRYNIIYNSFRFYHEAETTFSRLIHITGFKSRVHDVRCTDPHVLTSLKINSDGSQDLLFTYQLGKAPTLQTFALIFFGDQFYATVLGAWLIHIHAVNRINLNAVRAQLVKVPIVLKTDRSYSGAIHFQTSLKNVEIFPADIMQVEHDKILDVVVHLTPSCAGVSVVLINAIEQQTKNLLNTWMIVINVQEADITKVFEVYVQNNRNQTIKLTIGNRYSVERSFRISSSHPAYVKIDNDIIKLAGYKLSDVLITFLFSQEVRLSEVLIFVTNVDNNLQEEAYLLKLIYQE